MLWNPSLGSACNSCCYYIFGKLASILPLTPLPDDIEWSLLDFQVDAHNLVKLEGKQHPIPPSISVSGNIGSWCQ
ncbi:hypothetical protein M422DRAFT_255765 [Sphaerobolus stellatus SS14]|uniref:Uncharacterized protein n=1 Tax=Sphaerobolus stellatus (strain SS14) TaxID=990650 RepID=A0A0C9VIE0_SPHS4|nr:hypothetical protein M422DRAFT_255765 [Sphaerobolus stellatus SS14]